MKYVKRTLKFACLAVIFGIIGFLLVRIIVAEYYPSVMKSLYPTEALRQAWEEDPALQVRRQDLRISYDNAKFAHFMAAYQYYSPEAKELQIALRYNNSTLREMERDFSLPADSLTADPALFDITLVDEYGNRARGTCVAAEGHFMYQYMKVVFSDVSFSAEPGWLRVEIYYHDAVDYEKEAYAMIPLYEKELEPYDTFFSLSEVFS